MEDREGLLPGLSSQELSALFAKSQTATSQKLGRLEWFIKVRDGFLVCIYFFGGEGEGVNFLSCFLDFDGFGSYCFVWSSS